MSPKKQNKKPIETYQHSDKERLNNPPVGLVWEGTDTSYVKKKTYAYDPHLDPQLQWAGKTEHTSFAEPTVSLHVHERIDPVRIIKQVQNLSPAGVGGQQMSLFEQDKKPLREAIEFYKHRENWSNRLIAGDSLLVMNSLLEKEGLGGKVQMIYIDPPYGIRYGSNFQPFVNKRDVKDGKDEDLTAEPEMIKAFRDTWELGIHSYLTYLRDRLLLARELLHESGSVFVQISDENVHHVRELMDEVFGMGSFCAIIPFRKKLMPLGAKILESMCDYIVWYSRNREKVKYRTLHKLTSPKTFSRWTNVQLPDGLRRKLIAEETTNSSILPAGSKVYRLVSQRAPSFVVQTSEYVIQRCLLMTTDPGDLVLDPTCGSGTTAYVAEQWGRRWITTDTSRVAITLAKQRLMTAHFDYYELAHPQEGVGSGFRYKTVPHITLKSIANNEPPGEETLYDQPFKDTKKTRVTGPFMVEAVPAPVVKTFEEAESPSSERSEQGDLTADLSIARSGETLRQDEWRQELFKTGVRAKGGQLMEFTRVEPLGGARWLQAEAETKSVPLSEGDQGGGIKRVLISFGPEHAPLEQRQVELALEEAGNLRPKPDMLLFCAFQFDADAAKDGWAKLARNLKAEIDEEKIEAFRGTVSLPFKPGQQIAVKIIDDRGIESFKIMRI